MTSESSQFSASSKSGSYLASRISMIISNQYCQPDPVRVFPQHKAPSRKLQFTSACFGLSIFVIDQVVSCFLKGNPDLRSLHLAISSCPWRSSELLRVARHGGAIAGSLVASDLHFSIFFHSKYKRVKERQLKLWSDSCSMSLVIIHGWTSQSLRVFNFASRWLLLVAASEDIDGPGKVVPGLGCGWFVQLWRGSSVQRGDNISDDVCGGRLYNSCLDGVLPLLLGCVWHFCWQVQHFATINTGVVCTSGRCLTTKWQIASNEYQLT